MREGPEIWFASLLIAPPDKRIPDPSAISTFLVRSNAPAASPNVRPSRVASYGLHGAGLIDLNEAKPEVINSHKASAPATTTCLHSVLFKNQRATTKAETPEMHALDIIIGLFAQPKCSAIIFAETSINVLSGICSQF